MDYEVIKENSKEQYTEDEVKAALIALSSNIEQYTPVTFLHSKTSYPVPPFDTPYDAKKIYAKSGSTAEHYTATCANLRSEDAEEGRKTVEEARSLNNALLNKINKLNPASMATRPNQSLCVILPTDKKLHKCQLCAVSFSQEDRLREHVETIHCKVEETKSQCKQSHVCQASCTRMCEMNQHLQIHTKPLNCELFDAGFNLKSRSSRHARIHSGEKPYKCDLCNSSFSQSDTLKERACIHTCEKSYKCDLCDSSFSQSSSLKQHARIHTGEKPYKCDLCTSSFSQSSSLKQHARIHTGEKPYKCNLCNLCFSHSGHLKQHTRIHTGEKPYKCDLCTSCFSHPTTLKRHACIHTGEKLYKCDLCNSSFSRSDTLKDHTRVHTGEKPYKCDLCDSSFSWLSSLKRHAHMHTG